MKSSAIWLFRDKASYATHALKTVSAILRRRPYGYYSTQHRALLMNIATGGGTLVHEIVHPFMRANFPACPAWFNEGLGSLFEQSADREGHLPRPDELASARPAAVDPGGANNPLPKGLLGHDRRRVLWRSRWL